MKAYCYTGDIKALIPAGWKFQKLYASNYKTYQKDDAIMYVVSKMAIEIDWMSPEEQVTVIDFILKNRDKSEDFWQSFSDIPMFKTTKFANWCIMEGEIITDREALDRHFKFIDEFRKDKTIPYVKEGKRIEWKLVQLVLDLDAIGGIELKDINNG